MGFEPIRQTERVSLWGEEGQFYVRRGTQPDDPVLWHDNDRARAEQQFARLDAEAAAADPVLQEQAATARAANEEEEDWPASVPDPFAP